MIRLRKTNESYSGNEFYEPSEGCEFDGFYITAAELEQREREAFEAGRYGRYTRTSLFFRPLQWSEIQHDFDYKDFDDYLKQRKEIIKILTTI